MTIPFNWTSNLIFDLQFCINLLDVGLLVLLLYTYKVHLNLFSSPMLALCLLNILFETFMLDLIYYNWDEMTSMKHEV